MFIALSKFVELLEVHLKIYKTYFKKDLRPFLKKISKHL